MKIDYHEVVVRFPGRVYEEDCGGRCAGPHRCCSFEQWCPLAPGEGAFLADHGFQVAYNPMLAVDVYHCRGRQDCPGALRPVVCRQYPLSPGKAGLMVHRGCSEHKWMSWDFVMQMERMWRYLLSEGKDVALWVAKLEEAAWSREDRVPLYEVEREFGTEYTERFGQWFRPDLRERVFALGWVEPGESLLDVGGGRGEGAERLRALGVEAGSLDVNERLVGDERNILGDVRHLELEDDSFDVVVCIDVLEHLTDWMTGLREMLRVSRDRVAVYVGTLEDTRNMLMDPTHKVFLPFTSWLGAFNAEADVVQVDWAHTGVLLRKRER